MAGQRIDIMELRSLITFKQKGLSNRKIAALMGINRKTVDEYISIHPTNRMLFNWDYYLSLYSSQLEGKS
ncbi:hypothetical protein [Anditalea andensis]|uniref:HTH IS21-type domain-containing protein n=1 Tax=Anditalea andensis TaxID=1048983 RepID=A0A074L1G1_9BACT|nr:hypothetical protein [Anditalea andensis]KEO73673.1 hypothetical protein EL17_11070 [Anditalea andensis]